MVKSKRSKSSNLSRKHDVVTYNIYQIYINKKVSRWKTLKFLKTLNNHVLSTPTVLPTCCAAVHFLICRISVIGCDFNDNIIEVTFHQYLLHIYVQAFLSFKLVEMLHVVNLNANN